MKLTPAQMGIELMIHGWLPMMQYESRAEGIVRGRQQLMQITNEDFGFDLISWHKHLIETDAGGYKWGNRHRPYAREIERAMASDEWQEAVKFAESESLLDVLAKRDARQRDAVDHAKREWGDKVRGCPKCSTQFKSVGDRGQCPDCGHIFYASHPELGNVMWWLRL